MTSSRGTATRNNLTIVARRNRPGGSILSAKLAYFLAAINRHDPAKFPPGSENAVHQTLDSQKIVDDMNCAYPERAALEFFWERLSPGAVVLLDDYAYRGYEQQATAIDIVANAMGADVLSLPTGQGIIVK